MRDALTRFRASWRGVLVWAVILLVVVAGVAAWQTRDRWRGALNGQGADPDSREARGQQANVPADGHSGDATRLATTLSHSGHAADRGGDQAHDHADRGLAHGQGADGDSSPEETLELSVQAMKTIGLQTEPVVLRSFTRYMTFPAIVVPQPGRARVEVTAPLGGVVERIYVIVGEAVETGQPLFDVRLTHEELVQAQGSFLQTAEELDVVAQEIERLRSIQVPGVIPGKTIREREYEQQKLRAIFNAKRQSLLLHGLSDSQVDQILATRRLVQRITVVAPAHAEMNDPEDADHPFTVRRLHVNPGQYADAGSALCELMDYGHLYIQGRAFEQDADELLRAAREQWDLLAVLADPSQSSGDLKGLRIAFIENEVAPVSRALHFYVPLPNTIVHETTSSIGHRFVTWRYKSGQRMQVRVPVETWGERIVLSTDGVARDGVEYYAFLVEGTQVRRVPVHVEYRDQFSVVIANDGTLPLGAAVVTRGGQQLQMAFKVRSSNVSDHHGHTH